MNPEQIIILTCQDCSKIKTCMKTCVFIDRLAGNGGSTKEKLPPPNPLEDICYGCEDVKDCNGQCSRTDYKLNLLETLKQRETFREGVVLNIRELQDVRLKAISALLYVDFKVADIPYAGELLNIKERRIYQIIKEGHAIQDP